MNTEGKMLRNIHQLAATTVVGASLCMGCAAPALANHYQQNKFEFWETENRHQQCRQESRMLAGDFHQHTLYTDGSTSF